MSEEVITLVPTGPLVSQRHHKPERKPHTWRSRSDPFADVWEFLYACLRSHPKRTAKSIFCELQVVYPGRFPDMHLRTLQRGVHRWWQTATLRFADHWMEGDQFTPPVVQGESTLPATPCGSSAEPAVTATEGS